MGHIDHTAVLRAPHSAPSRPSHPRGPFAMVLEPRLMFDGAAAATAADAGSSGDGSSGDADAVTAEAPISASVSSSRTTTVADDRTEVAIIDTQVSGYEVLAQAASDAGIEVILISGEDDGIGAVIDALADRTDIDALHILSHGGVGEIQLGDAVLSLDTLDDESDLLTVISDALSEDGDLLLYGCKVGADDEGQDFVETLAILTGADVAASDDATGATTRGGDWDLEITTGLIESTPWGALSTTNGSIASTWQHTLGQYYAAYHDGNGWYEGYLTGSDTGYRYTGLDYNGTPMFRVGDANGNHELYSVSNGSIYIEDIGDKQTSGAMIIATNATTLGSFDVNDITFYGNYDEVTFAVTITGYLASGGTVTTGAITGIYIAEDDSLDLTDALSSAFDDFDDVVKLKIAFSDVYNSDPSFGIGAISITSLDLTDLKPPYVLFTTANDATISETATADGSVLTDIDAIDNDGNTTADANVTYSITGGNDDGIFAIDAASGEITVADPSALDYETTSSYTLTITGTDTDGSDAGSSFSTFITLSVTDEAPVITSGQSFTVSETAATNTSLGTVSLTGDTTPITYSIQSGNDDGIFAIDAASGEITVADSSALDYETTSSYTLTIRASDGTTNDDEAVTISVTDEPPVITSGQTFTVSEAAATNTSLGTVNLAGDTTPVTFSITGGNDDGIFAIDAASGEITVADPSALDYEATSSYTLTIRAEDPGFFFATTITISVTDAAPVITSGQSFTVKETDANSTSLGTVSLTGDTTSVTYSIQSGNTNDVFAINASTGEITLNDTTQLDAGATPSYTLTIRASDGNTNAEQTVTISVTDDVAPTVTGVASSSNDGTYAIGDTITVTVTFDEAITVSGTPTLTLNSGGTATYDSANSTSTVLAFTYTVQAGDTASDLDYTSTSALALAGGTIQDAAGNDATLTLASPGATGSLADSAALVVDGVAPSVTTVASSTADGTYGIGNTITVTVTFDEAVTVTGTPTLTLETGDTDRTATYSTGTGTDTLTFTYTVEAGDTASDLDYTSTSALALAGGTIKDTAGNDATLTLPSPGASGSLADSADLVVSTSAPTVQSVSASTADGSYKEGDTIDITVTFTTAVTITGTPTLTLETGTNDQTAAYSGGDGTNTLTFTYTVQAGDTASDLDYTTTSALALSGGTIQDSSGADADLTLASPGTSGSLADSKDLVIDTTAATVTGVASSSNDGTYAVGDTITVTVTFDEAVTVSGSPTLTLETDTTDRTATFSGGSGTNTLSFTYTVQAGDTASDLDYTSTSALALAGGTIKDAAGNDATLTLASPGASGSLADSAALVVDGVASTVISVGTTSGDGTYAIGDTITVTVTFDEAVTVSGTPTLTLNSGGTATYSDGTGTSTLNFTYTVQAGDTASDLEATALSGGTIQDAAGNDATLTLPATGSGDSLADGAALVVDGVVPSVTTVASSTADGTYTEGDTITITVTFDDAVTVTGTPTLTLETGTTDRVATYDSANSTSTVLAFTYTVQAGDTASDLDYASTSALALAGGTIRDSNGNDASLTLPSPGGSGSLGDSATLVIDTTAPTVQSVSASTADGSYKEGDVITLTVTFDEAVTVTGTPTLTLETGTTDRTATYASGSGTNTLTFTYTVQAGDTTSDLDYTTTSALALAGGTIKDGVGNDATLTLASPGATGSLADSKDLVIDTTAATVTGVASSSNDGSYVVGDTITVTVTFDEAVTVSGTPTLTLNSGGTATYSDGTGTSTLNFTYTVQAGDTASDLDYTSTSALALAGGTIKDAAGNDATLTLPTPGGSGSLADSAALVVDGVAPTVTNVTSTTTDGTYGEGTSITITVTFDEAVTVTGTPTLTLETGLTDRTATFSGGSGTNTLSFTYTVQSGDTTSDLDYTSTSALALAGGTIRDANGNDATLTLPTPGDTGSLGDNKALVITDLTAPTVSGVASSTSDGTYGIGDTVTVTVTFDEAVIVTGTPTLTLETGTTDRTATYASGSGTDTLSFTYTVVAGDTARDLDYTSTGALALAGGTIQDASGNDATLTLPTPGAAGSLSANQALVIDGEAPTVTSVASSTADGTYTEGDTLTITVTFDDVVTVTGTPTLALETGLTDRTATYASGSGTNTLSFTYTVQAGDTASDLDYTATSALALAGGTIQDANGNDATLTLPTPGSTGSLSDSQDLVISDTTAPTVQSVSSTTADGTYGTGDTITITVTFDEAVAVTGTPTLTLETGTTDRTATYTSGSGTNTLSFTYTVQAGDTVSDLDYVSTSALALAGGTIQDGAGNDATLTLPAPGGTGSLGDNTDLVIFGTSSGGGGGGGGGTDDTPDDDTPDDDTENQDDGDGNDPPPDDDTSPDDNAEEDDDIGGGNTPDDDEDDDDDDTVPNGGGNTNSSDQNTPPITVISRQTQTPAPANDSDTSSDESTQDKTSPVTVVRGQSSSSSGTGFSGPQTGGDGSDGVSGDGGETWQPAPEVFTPESVDVIGRTSPANNSFPVVVINTGPGSGAVDGLVTLRPDMQVPQQVGETGQITFTLPTDTFAHTDANAQIQLSATQENGAPLPSWLSFDPATGTFIGEPPPGTSGEIVIRVTARDQSGREAAVIVHITPQTTQQGDASDTLPVTDGDAPTRLAANDDMATDDAASPAAKPAFMTALRQERSGMVDGQSAALLAWAQTVEQGR